MCVYFDAARNNHKFVGCLTFVHVRSKVYLKKTFIYSSLFGLEKLYM